MKAPDSVARRPKRRWWMKPAVLAVIMFLGGFAANLLSNHVYPSIKPYIIYVWGVLIIAFIATIIAAIRGERGTEDDPTSSNDPVPPRESSGNIIYHVQGNLIQNPSSSPGAAPVATSENQNAASSVAPSTPFPSPLHQLPPPPRAFTGREEELKVLLEGLDKGGAAISGLRGMGGIGKTALALVLGDRIKDRFPDARIFLELHGTDSKPLSPEGAMGRVVHTFHPEARLPEGLEELQAFYHSVLEGKRVLILGDNAHDASQVKPLIPPVGCFLLVTSRYRFELKGWETLDLSVLPKEKGEELLRNLAPRIGDQAAALARSCGYLPLALCLAGGAIRARTELSPEDYLRRLDDARQRLKQLDKHRELTEEDRGVEASLELSYNLLPTDEHRKFWRVLGVFPGSFDVAAAAAVGKLEEEAAIERLGDLYIHSILERDGSIRRYRLHDLLRDFAMGRMTENNEEEDGRKRHSEYFVGILRQVDKLYMTGGEKVVEGLGLFDRERLNIEAGQAWAAKNSEMDDDAARLCSNYPDAGVYCLEIRQHPRNERIPWLESALSAARRLKDRSKEGVHLGNLGLAYSYLGETRKAIEFHEKALVIAKEIGDRRGEGNVLGNLGSVYHILGETRKAIEFHEKALFINREIGDRRGEGNTLGNLGNDYNYLGETRKAIEFYEKALFINREMGDRRGEGNALGNLGVAYKNLGETQKAIEFHEKALVIDREIGDRRGEGADLGNLGNAYNILGETKKAIGFHEQYLVIAREIGDRRGEGNAQFNMSLSYDQLGERDKAIQLARAALEIYEKIEDPNIVKVRQKLEQWNAK